jgi:hypothetical protein
MLANLYSGVFYSFSCMGLGNTISGSFNPSKVVFFSVVLWSMSTNKEVAPTHVLVDCSLVHDS